MLMAQPDAKSSTSILGKDLPLEKTRANITTILA